MKSQDFKVGCFLMSNYEFKSEIRDSVIRDLLEKARKGSYKQYLLSIRLEKIRMFRGAQINFDFPVTALIGPNGGGKSTVIGAAACTYSTLPQNIFRNSRVGDEGMDDWGIEYELIDRGINTKGSIRTNLTFQNNKWTLSRLPERSVKLIGITRTLPTSESPLFHLRRRITSLGSKKPQHFDAKMVEGIDQIKREAERILGKSLTDFKLYEISTVRKKARKLRERVRDGEIILEDGRIVPRYTKKSTGVEVIEHTLKQLMYVGSNGEINYSEFNFGAGESSIIKLVAEVEALPDNSLILVEEIENGLHPLAVRRTVEYFIDVARRKNAQIIFTTHSDYALAPLPSEAIWAATDGRLQQGKLSVEVLRAVSGRIDKRLAVFVEDNFAKAWVESVIRERLSDNFEEIGIYPVYGDGNAVKIHLGHTINPAIAFRSICFIDGDSKQVEDGERNIFRLPGDAPEATVFNSVINNLGNNIALLTVACQRPIARQDTVAEAIRGISSTNRDPHLLFSQLGITLGFVPEDTVRGAFFTVWMQEMPDDVSKIAEPIMKALELPPKR
jgi:predicted ATPase